jgi:hypothetical protein
LFWNPNCSNPLIIKLSFILKEPEGHSRVKHKMTQNESTTGTKKIYEGTKVQGIKLEQR